jgi:hypothetical protein
MKDTNLAEDDAEGRRSLGWRRCELCVQPLPNLQVQEEERRAKGEDEDEGEEEVLELPSKREMVAWEAAQILEQQKRLSVWDLASKFEKGWPLQQNYQMK